MADLTELDVNTLDGLLHFYLELVYLPECENEYRRRQDAQTQQALDDQAKLGRFDRALFDPDNPPELLGPLNIGDTRRQFEQTYLTNDWISVLVPLCERAGLHWDAALAKEKGRLAAFRTTIQQWSKEEWDARLPDPRTIKWDLDIADVHPSGGAFIGPQSRYDAIVHSASVARAMQTLANIASGVGGTAGYLRDGDEGSDRGALATAFLPGGGRGGGPKGRAGRRNNMGRKGTGSRGTGSTATGLRGTGSRGTGARTSSPRRSVPKKQPQTALAKPPSKRTSPPKQPAAATSPPKQPQRRTSEQRAADRATSAQAAAAGEKLTPMVEAKLAKAKVDIKDDYTRENINKIYATNRNDAAKLSKAHANSGELRGLVREGNYPDVKSVRFLRPVQGKGERTPDIEKTMKDGSKEFVEVRTITGSPSWAKVKHAKSVRAPITGHFMESVEGKLRHGQISEKHPGKFLFHAQDQTITSTALEGWREMLGTIIKKGPLPKGLKAIEITGVPDKRGTTSMLIFKGPKWQGVLVQ